MWTPRLVVGVGVLAAVVATSGVTAAQTRTDVTIDDTGVSPESLTSSADGSLFFGSTAKGTVYRAAPGAAAAEAWIPASTTGLTNVLGVLADDRTNTLWVCANATGGRGRPPAGETALRRFDLKTGAPTGTYPFPGGGLCNDIAVASDGTAYVSDTMGGRVLRWTAGASSLEVFVADARLAGIDGVALLSDRDLYANSYFSGKLFHVSLRPGGAGDVTEITTSSPFVRPDGLRSTSMHTLLQAEGQGRLTEITIAGTHADVRVIREGLTAATAVTVIGDTAFVLSGRLKAVAVPYGGRE
jgi:sugar lactone lactonase YvrE